jgi:RNA polymerase sigma-70 factor (ECF subfamily)
MADDTDGPGNDSTDLFVAELQRHRQPLFAFIYSLLPRRADAEDVYQKTCEALWRKFDTWDRRSSFRTWACGYAWRYVANHGRVAGRERLWLDDDTVAKLADERAADLDRHDDRLAALAACMESLSRDERRLLDSAYRDKQPLKVVAAQMGRAVQTLYNQLNMIRRKLHQCVRMRTGTSGGVA